MNEKLENIIKGLPFTLTEEQDFFIRDFISGSGLDKEGFNEF